MSVINEEDLTPNENVSVDKYINFLKRKFMIAQSKYYILDEKVEFTDFIKTLEVLKDYRIPYSLTEECYNKKITVNLYVCKNSIIEIAKVIRELEINKR